MRGVCTVVHRGVCNGVQRCKGVQGGLCMGVRRVGRQFGLSTDDGEDTDGGVE